MHLPMQIQTLLYKGKDFTRQGKDFGLTDLRRD